MARFSKPGDWFWNSDNLQTGSRNENSMQFMQRQGGHRFPHAPYPLMPPPNSSFLASRNLEDCEKGALHWDLLKELEMLDELSQKKPPSADFTGSSLPPLNLPLSRLLLIEELNKLSDRFEVDSGAPSTKLNLCKSMRLMKKVAIPVSRYPTAPFKGKIIGRGGARMRDLVEKTSSRVNFCGFGSRKDTDEENTLRQNSLEPADASLHEHLHVRIETCARPAEAYERLSAVLSTVDGRFKEAVESAKVEPTPYAEYVDFGEYGEFAEYNEGPSYMGDNSPFGFANGVFESDFYGPPPLGAFTGQPQGPFGGAGPSAFHPPANEFDYFDDYSAQGPAPPFYRGGPPSRGFGRPPRRGYFGGGRAAYNRMPFGGFY